MFSALVLICAVYSGEVSPVCAEFKDEWGPYKTFDNCSIRTNQMVDVLMSHEDEMYAILGNPEALEIAEMCVDNAGEFL